VIFLLERIYPFLWKIDFFGLIRLSSYDESSVVDKVVDYVCKNDFENLYVFLLDQCECFSRGSGGKKFSDALAEVWVSVKKEENNIASLVSPLSDGLIRINKLEKSVRENKDIVLNAGEVFLGVIDFLKKNTIPDPSMFDKIFISVDPEFLDISESDQVDFFHVSNERVFMSDKAYSYFNKMLSEQWSKVDRGSEVDHDLLCEDKVFSEMIESQSSGFKYNVDLGCEYKILKVMGFDESGCLRDLKCFCDEMLGAVRKYESTLGELNKERSSFENKKCDYNRFMHVFVGEVKSVAQGERNKNLVTDVHFADYFKKLEFFSSDLAGQD